MYLRGKGDKELLGELFPLPCESFPTTGTQAGVILKFKTFYLKIYDDGNSDSYYYVQAFLYGKRNPVFIDRVRDNQMRRYAAQFAEEDHLESMIALHVSQQ